MDRKRALKILKYLYKNSGWDFDTMYWIEPTLDLVEAYKATEPKQKNRKEEKS